MAKRKGMGGHQSAKAKTDIWLTPPAILAALGTFETDPCTIDDHPWPIGTKWNFTKAQDGLLQPWEGRVFCNPPYGQNTALWLDRLANHGDGIALIFARTETQMFTTYVWDRAHAVFFLEGRLFFHHQSGEVAKANSGAPSVLIAYGLENAAILQRSGLRGVYIDSWKGAPQNA